ncbi:MerR family transcriptional regulator [Achromobacter sp. MFA1 R4]|uniref:MerR family transcriptional regulator n=1 Tax=Achromobacter sp. MFA1 R4 TaxID=1881016 RepID=UPI00095391B6|nr:MerR family transcriptional regulator [Achromobacter sp. MFA1 R4]SIT33182.1 DNA-binding transcriptional regulator, MerR family [Achromobacter sp. MFA1 R4]
MTRTESTVTLPPIPAKRYFTIGEVSDLCGVKPHVLRYWEQEFTQLKPVKRRGNRRYYQHHEVLLIRRIRSLLYEQGFTISGARNRLGDARDVPHDQDAAVRLSGTEIQSLRSELTNVSAMLAEALGNPAAATPSAATATQAAPAA